MDKRRRLQKKADKALQEYIRQKYPKCFICGKKSSVGHHFFPKSTASALRYNLNNIIPLCHSCHFSIHQKSDPRATIYIKEKKGSKWYKNLINLKNKPLKITISYYINIIEKLQQKREK